MTTFALAHGGWMGACAAGIERITTQGPVVGEQHYGTGFEAEPWFDWLADVGERST